MQTITKQMPAPDLGVKKHCLVTGCNAEAVRKLMIIEDPEDMVGHPEYFCVDHADQVIEDSMYAFK